MPRMHAMLSKGYRIGGSELMVIDRLFIVSATNLVLVPNQIYPNGGFICFPVHDVRISFTETFARRIVICIWVIVRLESCGLGVHPVQLTLERRNI